MSLNMKLSQRIKFNDEEINGLCISIRDRIDDFLSLKLACTSASIRLLI